MRESTSYCRCALLLWKINWHCWGNTGSTTPARSTRSCSAWRPYSNTGRGQNHDRIRTVLLVLLNYAIIIIAIVKSLTQVIVMSDLCCVFFFLLRYQRECAELSQWLQSALERLEFWNTQAVLVPQELETVRDHLAAFLVRPRLFSPFLSLLIWMDSVSLPTTVF